MKLKQSSETTKTASSFGLDQFPLETVKEKIMVIFIIMAGSNVS